MDARSFFKDERPEGLRSKLEPFLDELLLLHSARYSMNQMARFLAAHGVRVTPGAVAAFLRRRRRFAADAAAAQAVRQADNSTRGAVPNLRNGGNRPPRERGTLPTTEELMSTPPVFHMPKTADIKKEDLI
jgi:hypothetical protein